MLFLFKCWAFVLWIVEFPCFFPMTNTVLICVLLRIWLICSQQPGAIWNWNSGMLQLVKDNSCFSSLSWKKDQTCAGAKQIPPWLHLHGSESPQPLWSWLQKPQSPANIAVLSAFQCGHSFGHPATLAQRYNSQTGAAWNLGWIHWPVHTTVRRVMLTVLGELLLNVQWP